MLARCSTMRTARAAVRISGVHASSVAAAALCVAAASTLQRIRHRTLHSCGVNRLSADASAGVAAPTTDASAAAAAAAVSSSSTASGVAPPYRMVLFASSDFSVATLHALASSSGLLEGPLTVVTPADKPRGRGKQVSASPFKAEALKLGCEVVDLPDKTNFKMTGWDLPPSLRNAVDVGVVVSFGYMLPDRLISQFRHGVVNIHPSLLPAYRGSSPIQFAIARGDRTTGVSIIDVHPTRIDGGDIISQESTVRRVGGAVPRAALRGRATFASMSPVLAEQGARQLMAVLQNLGQARAQRRTQPQAQPAAASATPAAAAASGTAVASPSSAVAPAAAVVVHSSAPRIPKSAGQLLFGIHSPERLYRIWAGCAGFVPVWSTFHGERVAIQELVHPDEAAARMRAADEAERAAADAGTPIQPPPAHFPTFAEAQQLGVGGLFFEPRLQSLGVICASSALDDPRVLYVSQVQLAFKAAPVSALTFALGYLDKRKIKASLHSSWKFVSSEEGPAGGKPLSEIDFWGPKLNAPAATPAAV